MNKILTSAYWVGLIALATAGLIGKLSGTFSWKDVLHLVYYLPAISMLTVISGQMDLLEAITKGELINIKARVMDFAHWLLLICLNIGAWMKDGVSVSWFVLKIILLDIIGWQIGRGVARRWKFTVTERWVGAIGLVVAMALGLGTGMIRAIDTSPRGWGWQLESITASLGTLIVIWWIGNDISAIKVKARGYPRSNFLKGIFANSLMLLFWAHTMILQGGFSNIAAWLDNLGLSVSVLVGNGIYLVYYALYEYYRRIQAVTTTNT